MQTMTVFDPAARQVRTSIAGSGQEAVIADGVRTTVEARTVVEAAGGRLPPGSQWRWEQHTRVFRLHLGAWPPADHSAAPSAAQQETRQR